MKKSNIVFIMSIIVVLVDNLVMSNLSVHIKYIYYQVLVYGIMAVFLTYYVLLEYENLFLNQRIKRVFSSLKFIFPIVIIFLIFVFLYPRIEKISYLTTKLENMNSKIYSSLVNDTMIKVEKIYEKKEADTLYECIDGIYKDEYLTICKNKE